MQRVNEAATLDAWRELGAAGGWTTAGGGAEQISDNTRSSELILAPAVDEGYVYWSIYDELYRASVGGGLAEMFGTLTLGTSARLLLADQGSLYWGSGSLFEYAFGGVSNTSVAPHEPHDRRRYREAGHR